MFRKILFLIIITFAFIVGYFSRGKIENLKNQVSQDKQNNPISDRSLDKYTIENLKKANFTVSDFKITKILKEGESFNSYLFSFRFNPNLDGKTFKNVSGQINLPSIKESKFIKEKFPVILMLRGFINQKTYKTGDGTRNASEYFAKNGFITIAPDFLGYGESDKEAGNIFESRFQTYVTAISLLKYLENNPEIIFENNKYKTSSNIFIWGHSNGGQIALTILEISGKEYPTTLWAPVSKSFPYSILYYTDESEDKGKLIRSELAKFESEYDVEKYSLTNYLDKINAPLQIHQGENDQAVPKSWSDNLVSILRKKGKKINYFTYENTDHNMRPNWNKVIEEDLKFFKKYIED